METGPYPLDGVKMPTWLLRFDKHGACISPETRGALLSHLVGAKITDVIVFAHGWNNDFDAACDLYRKFLDHFEALVARYPPERPFDPLFLGITWPSTWLVFDKGPVIATEGTPSGDSMFGDVVAAMAERLAIVEPQSLERFYGLLERPQVSGSDANAFATLLAPIFDTIVDEETGGNERRSSVQGILEMLVAAETAVRLGGAPAKELDDWGPGPVGGDRMRSQPNAAGLLQSLDPRNAIRLFSVYQMKDRAGTVGYNGVSPLLRQLAEATSTAGSRIHLVGHSFGCKVMLSAVCSQFVPQRPFDSLLLLQPAVSHLCFAEWLPSSQSPGGYRVALDPTRVRWPILSTYSSRDFPLHDTFHIAMRRADDVGELKIAADTSTSAGEPPSIYAGLGGYGPRGAGQKLIDPMPTAGEPFVVDARTSIVAFDGSSGVIRGHGDVANSATAWALHRLIFKD